MSRTVTDNDRVSNNCMNINRTDKQFDGRWFNADSHDKLTSQRTQSSSTASLPRKKVCRSRNSSYSSQSSTQSNFQLCHYESTCYKQDCSFQHLPGDRVWDDRIQCDDYECTSNYPPGRPNRCSNSNTYSKVDYRLLHPNTHSVECIDGADCRVFQCRAWHPPNRSKQCSYGKRCNNITCLCLHPHGRSLNCKEGINCDNVSCSRLHPQEWDPKKESSSVQIRQLQARIIRQKEQKLKSFQQRMTQRAAAQLPILASRTDFCQRLITERVLVVTAETGSGKSTQLPQYAAEHFCDGLIVCTQPRVVAAKSLARRVADEYDGETEGHSVGYQVGRGSGKNMHVPGTRIMFMTDAALIRESHFNPTLSKVRVLIIDEAHERVLNTDIVVGIAKLLFNTRPHDFFVVISSATIDPTRFLEFFGRPLNQPLTVPGRLYEVSEEYLPPPSDCNDQKLIEKHVVPTVLRLYPKHQGHTLVFLQGQREIEQALKLFSYSMPERCVALPLYGSMSPEEQDEVLKFDDNDGKQRMVVFCTNVAETSLTIQNVRLVIDSGLAKEARFDITRRLTVIETVRISRSSAKQRKGRAGRTTTGHCVRLYNESDLKREHVQPEILRSSLDLVILQIVRLGLHPETFPFLDQPDPIIMAGALALLTRLSCIANETSLTTRGQLIAELALDPRLSTLMIEMYTDVGGEYLLTLTATIVAVLSAPGSLFFMGGITKEAKDEARTRVAIGAHEHDSDLFYLCAVYKRWKHAGIIDRVTNTCLTCHKLAPQRFDACRTCRIQYSNANGLNNKILRIIDSSFESYVKIITDPRWKLAACDNMSTTYNERDLIGEHLYKLFPEQLGHLLVSHLPDEGVRLISSNIRARIMKTSVLLQRLHDHGHQHFVSMSITQLPTGDYLVDSLHPVPSRCINPVPTRIVFSANKIGWLVNYEMRRKFDEYRSESWCKWLVYEYDQTICQVNVWGMYLDEHIVKPILQSALKEVYSQLLDRTRSLDCGPIRASFRSGLICTNIEKIDNALRLDLQHVPCATIDELHLWLRTKLGISRQDIKENSFRVRHRRMENDDNIGYEALPFHIVFKSTDAFQKASVRIPTYYICPRGSALSSSTTGTYMGEKDAWGRQLTITTAPGGSVLSVEQVARKLSPCIVDCRERGKKIRPAQLGIYLSNLSVDTDESLVRQALQPINPVKVSLRPPNNDGTGSSSALIFFADEQQRQHAWTILQFSLCQQPTVITIRTKRSRLLVQKNVFPKISDVRQKQTPSQTFLITATNRDVALKLFKEIIPDQEPTWHVDSSATMTVLQPNIYPDFDQLLQGICKQFGTNVQQQVLEKKHHHGINSYGIRCVFSHASPPKTALAAAMLAQATSSLVIKTSDYRQKCLFDELFEQDLIQTWSRTLNLVVVEKKNKGNSTIEIKGPQVQKGRLMRQIADYSDEFDSRFRIYDLSTRTAQFFGRQKAANAKMDQIAQKWLDQGCRVTYLYKTKSIAIYGQPKITLATIDECDREVKQMLSGITVSDDLLGDNRQCSFCGRMSAFIKRLRLCGHTYCHCASSLLTQTFPLQCHDANCKTNIDIYDLQEIYEPEEIIQICKRSLQHYLMANADADDRIFCPNGECDGLIKKSGVYQTCLTCGEHVCALCHIIDDDLHEGRTCAQRIKIIHEMGEFLPRLFDAGEKYARENWPPNLSPLIRIEYNMRLAEKCLSLERFYKGVIALGDHLPPDLARGFFAFHGTETKSILPICIDGFDPRRRKGQAYGVGEYFGVTAAISDGYCRTNTASEIKTMLVAFILRCPQVSTKVGFCHVVNNPIDWSYAYNLPVLIISYGQQASIPSIVASTPSVIRSIPSIVASTPSVIRSTPSIGASTPSTITNIASSSQVKKKNWPMSCQLM
ncbi:unnamed protein product [Rotaria sp. Silwood2]|nr:unnamed protein product [Rotaria sp. Silwood2]